jgi:predicted dehydrogenase
LTSGHVAPRAAIIGCGLVGRRRAAAFGQAHVVCCCDPVEERARELASNFHGAEAVADWRAVTGCAGIDLVVVATPHDALAPVATAAARSGKHVLVEKPGARRVAELEELAVSAADARVKVRVGFNHRYHPAVRKAREIAASGALGELMFVRGRYGHGGRPGYSREWRAMPDVSGGGELIDQGVHLIDLARWFLGDFARVRGKTATYFWNMAVEDNAFLLLETVGGQTAFLHAGWTEWKNLFSFEIAGRNGKLEISGLGGSYGIERLTHYRMLPEMGPPETACWEYPRQDDSWERETAEFLEDIALDREPSPGIRDAQEVLRVVEAVYEENQR